MKENDFKKGLIRLLKLFGIGAVIGAVVGGILGFMMGMFDIGKNDLPFSLMTIVTGVVFTARLLYVLATVMTVYYVWQVLKNYKAYQDLEDDDRSENLYRELNKKHAYALIWNNLSLVLALISLLLSYRLRLMADGAEFSISIIDFTAAILLSVFQIYLMRLYNRIRGFDVPLVPKIKELKNNIMRMDEAELEAHYKMSYDIVLTLSNIVLPTIYGILFFLSMLLQRVELTGILVAAVIHIYILAMQFKMTKDYYK